MFAFNLSETTLPKIADRRAKSEEPDCYFKGTTVILKYGDVENIAAFRNLWGNNNSEKYKYRGNKLNMYLRKQIFYTRKGTEPSNDPQIIENIPLYFSALK